MEGGRGGRQTDALQSVGGGASERGRGTGGKAGDAALCPGELNWMDGWVRAGVRGAGTWDVGRGLALALGLGRADFRWWVPVKLAKSYLPRLGRSTTNPGGTSTQQKSA